MKTKIPKTESKSARQTPSRGPKPGGNGSVHFALKETPAREVFLAGGFNGWSPTAFPLKKNGDDCWSAEIKLPPGRHEYLFVADGIWRPDPAAESAPNPFGGVNSIVNVPAPVGN
jgi:1,4-alpha-glucan branching enzyme